MMEISKTHYSGYREAITIGVETINKGDKEA